MKGKVTDSRHRLLELMDIYGVNQKDISEKSGVPRSAISMYITGNRVPRQDKIALICEAYNLDPAWFMGYDVPMQRRNPKETAVQDFNMLSKFHKLSDRDKGIIVNMIDQMIGDSQPAVSN